MADLCASCRNELPPDAAACAACGTARDPTSPDLQIGELVENAWRVERIIGRGGMGTVFLAADERLGRPVALKTLSSRLPDPEFAERFLREGRVLAAIDHPNVVAIHAVGRHRNIPFIVMRHVEGEPLSTVVRSRGGKLGSDEVLELVRQLAAALTEVHARGVVHRDLKPANVMMGHDGHVTLFDFGIARPTGSALTRTGIVFGTPGYMAPEVIVGERNMDGRADQYSLAVIVFELLTGFAPFIDGIEDQLLMKHLTAERPPVSVAGGIPVAVDAVVARAMAVDPAKRYPDVLEFCTALEAAFGVRIDERATIQRTPMQRPLGPDGAPLIEGAEDSSGPDIPIVTVEPTPPPRTLSQPGPLPVGGPGTAARAAPARTVSRPATVPVAGPGAVPPQSAAQLPLPSPNDPTPPPRRSLAPANLPSPNDPTPPPRRSLPHPSLPSANDPTPPPRRSLSRPGTIPAATSDSTDPSAPSASEPEATALVVDRWVRRHRGKLAAAIVAVLIAGVGLSFLFERPTTPPPVEPIPMNLVGMEVVNAGPAATAAAAVATSPEATADVVERIQAVEERSEQAKVDRQRRSAAARPRVRKQIVESGLDSSEGEIQVKVLLDGQKVGAIVALDGQRLGPAPVFSPARPGDHVVRVQYRPFPESVIPVQVKARSSLMLEVELRPLEGLADGPPPPKAARRR